MNKYITYIDPEDKNEGITKRIEVSEHGEFDINKCLSNNYNLHVQGHSGRGWKTRYFSFNDFNPKYANGFCKFVKRNDVLFVKVVDIYGFYTEEEKNEFERNGYILLGYEK